MQYKHVTIKDDWYEQIVGQAISKVIAKVTKQVIINV